MRAILLIFCLINLLVAATRLARAEDNDRPPPEVLIVAGNIILPCKMVRSIATPEYMARIEVEAVKSPDRPALLAMYARFKELVGACSLRAKR